MKTWVLALLALGTAGCSLAPGMTMLLPGMSGDRITVHQFSGSSKDEAKDPPGDPPGDPAPKPNLVTPINFYTAPALGADRGRDLAPEPMVTPITASLTRDLRQQQNETLTKQQAHAAPLRHNGPYRYRIGAGDILSIIVWDHPELTTPPGESRSAESAGYPVGPDGTIFFPYVGTIQAAGSTTQELRKVLTKGLSTYIEKPQLDVRIAAYRSQKVYVTGEVGSKPSTATGGITLSGILPITDVPLTALEAINQAGGPTPEADLHRVILTRQSKTYILDLQGLYETGVIDQNWVLQDGDLLYVADRNLNKVFVLGEVGQPAAYLMVKGRMSLAEALGNARGLDQATANAAKVYVIRNTDNGPEIYWLDGRSADAMLLANHFPMRPRDVVYVASTEVTRWSRFIQQVLPTMQTIYAPKGPLPF